jgi:glycine C-acetyltransferase
LAGYMSSIDKDTASRPRTSLLERLSPLPFGWDMLDDHRVDTFSKQIVGPVLTHAAAMDRKGRLLGEGINFASQDYLSLASHPKVSQAAVDAIAHYGVHSAGSPALMGNTTLSVELEKQLCEFLGMSSCALFPTGWGAGYGAARWCVRRTT